MESDVNAPNVKKVTKRPEGGCSSLGEQN